MTASAGNLNSEFIHRLSRYVSVSTSTACMDRRRRRKRRQHLSASSAVVKDDDDMHLELTLSSFCRADILGANCKKPLI